MDYRDNVRKAVAYIEANLRERVDLESVAAEACYSPYHFSRIFALTVGESPGGYLRRRRLSEAARRIRASDDRVLDIALEWGFGSQEAFSRAFKDEFGMTPGSYRKAAGPAVGRMCALADPVFVEGGAMIDFRIERLPVRLVAGFPCYGAPGPSGLFGEMWSLFNGKLTAHDWHCGKPGIGVEFYAGDCTDMDRWFYLAGSFADRLEDVPANLAVKPIPAGDYAVFTHTGTIGGLTATFRAAYGEALPEAGLEPWLPLDFELYDERFKGPDDLASVMEIWIPVRKKS